MLPENNVDQIICGKRTEEKKRSPSKREKKKKGKAESTSAVTTTKLMNCEGTGSAPTESTSQLPIYFNWPDKHMCPSSSCPASEEGWQTIHQHKLQRISPSAEKIQLPFEIRFKARKRQEKPSSSFNCNWMNSNSFNLKAIQKLLHVLAL